MEADFQRYYGLDLLDLYRGRLSMPKAARLAEWLPADGAVARALGSEGFALTEHLLCAVVDALNVANWQRANAGAPRHKQTKPPAPVPRPGLQQPAKREITAADLMQFKRRHAKP